MSRSYYYNDEIVEENYDYQVEDLVKQTRLKAIEKEFKSIGSILDTRKLYRLEEIKQRVNIPARHTSTFRINNRRKGLTDYELRVDKDNALNQLRNKGISIPNILGDFQEEEMIYKTISSDPKYTLQRQYENPELHKFYEKLTLEERKVYKDKCLETIVLIAQNLRDEMAVKKTIMDQSGVFHSTANEQRVHCLYLMRFYKSITSKKIEDPILIEMMTNKLKEEGKFIENIDSQKSLKKDRKKLFEPKFEPSKIFTFTNNNSHSNIKLLMKNPTTNDHNLLSNDNNKQTLTKLPDQTNKRNSISNNKINNTLKFNKIQATSDKIFQRIKKNRLGAVFPAELLPDESLKFELGEVHNEKRNYDSSSLLDEHMISWMSNELQESEIMKSSINNTSINSLSNESMKDIKVRLNNVLSYDDFHHMFLKYNELAKKEKSLENKESYKIDTLLEKFNNTVGVKESKNKNMKSVSEPLKTQRAKSPIFAEDNNMIETSAQDNFSPRPEPEIDRGKATPLSSVHPSSKALFKDISLKRFSNKPFSNDIGKNAIKTAEMSLNRKKTAIKGFHNHFKMLEVDSDEETETFDESDLISVASSTIDIIHNHKNNNNNNTSSTTLEPIKESSTVNERVFNSFKKKNNFSSKDSAIASDTTDPILSDKLLEIWDCIDVSYIHRVDFMKKYSTTLYSTEFSRAIDLWGELAVYVKAREQLQKLHYKYKKGYCVPPILPSVLIDAFNKSINPIFLSNSKSLIPSSYDTAIQSNNTLSSVAVKEINELFLSIFDLFNGVAESVDQIHEILIKGGHEIDEKMKNILEFLHSELDDTVYYGNINCLDWITQTIIS